jgi:hypothetical protein
MLHVRNEIYSVVVLVKMSSSPNDHDITILQDDSSTVVPSQKSPRSTLNILYNDPEKQPFDQEEGKI